MAFGNSMFFSTFKRAVLLLLVYLFRQHFSLIPICEAYLIRDVCQDQLLKQEAEEPPELAGLWISTQCEARPENEYLVRHYQFYLNATFELHQFYYNTPNCDRNPVYSVTAYGRFRGMQRSWILLGGVEAEYALYKVIVTPHNREALRQIRPLYEQQCLHAKLDHDYWTVNSAFVILRDDSVMLNPLTAGRTLQTQGGTSGNAAAAALPTVGVGVSNMFGAMDSSSSSYSPPSSRGSVEDLSATVAANENSTMNNLTFLSANGEDSAELNIRTAPSRAAGAGEARSHNNNNNNVFPIPTSIRLRTSAVQSAAAAASAAAVDIPLDCLELFNITFNELQLFRVEKSFWLQQSAAHSSEAQHEAWQVHHRQRMSRLLWLGNIYPHYQWRSEFKPASYQIFPLHFADGLVLTSSASSPSSSSSSAAAAGASSFLKQPSPTVSTPVSPDSSSSAANSESGLISSLINFVDNQQHRTSTNSQQQHRGRANNAHANNINSQRAQPALPQAHPQSTNQKWLPLAFADASSSPANATLIATQNKEKEVLIYQTIAGAWHSTHNCEVEEDGAFIRREVLFGPRGEWSMMNTHFRDAACLQKLRTDLGIGRWTLDNTSGNNEDGSSTSTSNRTSFATPRDTEAARRRQLIESLEKINNEFSDTIRLPSERLYRQASRVDDSGGAKSVQVDPPLQLDDLAALVQVNVDQMFITLHDTSLVSVMKDTGCGHNDWAVDVRVNVTALPQCHRLGIRVPSTRHTSLLLYRDLYGNLLLFVALHVGRTSSSSSSSRDSSSSGSATGGGAPAPMRASPPKRSSSLNSAYYAKESGLSGGGSSASSSSQYFQNSNSDVLVLRHPLVNCKKRGLQFNLLQTSLPPSHPSTSTTFLSSSSSSSTRMTSSSKSTIAQQSKTSAHVTAAPSLAPSPAGRMFSASVGNSNNHESRPYELPRNFNNTTSFASSTKLPGSVNNENERKISNDFNRARSHWSSSTNSNRLSPQPPTVPSRTPHLFVPIDAYNEPPAVVPTYSYGPTTAETLPDSTWRSNHVRPSGSNIPTSNAPVTLITYDVGMSSNDATGEYATPTVADAESATQQQQQQQASDQVIEDVANAKSGGTCRAARVAVQASAVFVLLLEFYFRFLRTNFQTRCLEN